MEFKDRVIYLRAKLNLTQKQLGELMEVSLVTINRWENGKVLPTKKDQIRFDYLCKSYNVLIAEVEE